MIGLSQQLRLHFAKQKLTWMHNQKNAHAQGELELETEQADWCRCTRSS